MKIIDYVRPNGSVKTRDIVGLFHISRQAALKELKVLIGQDLLIKEGIRKNSHYVLK